MGHHLGGPRHHEYGSLALSHNRCLPGLELFVGEIKAFSDLKILATIVSFLSLFTIAFGDWIYIAYRAKGGPREQFLQSIPEVHEIFFEFKEFIALLTLPMFAAATFILWQYGDGIIKHRILRTALFIILVLGYVYPLLAFGLGAAITKLRSV